MTHIHVRRFRSDDDDPDLTFGPYTGAIADLTLYEEPADDGLVDRFGKPIPRSEPPRKRLGFLPERACRD